AGAVPRRGRRFKRISCHGCCAGLVVALVAGALWISEPPASRAQGWTATRAPAGRLWSSVTATADGARWVAAVRGGLIYTSTNGGVCWMTNPLPSLQWRSVACSADGTKLVAAAYFGPIYTSTNSGATWSS